MNEMVRKCRVCNVVNYPEKKTCETCGTFQDNKSSTAATEDDLLQRISELDKYSKDLNRCFLIKKREVDDLRELIPSISFRSQ